ncbi:MAG: AraC family transcriptional regulator [Deltaproteobacteria bacterium]|nr:AraC family transcriptional regulator [Deltaproteobacteria bacterium]
MGYIYTTYIIVSGIFLYWLLAAGLLVIKRKTPDHYLTAFLLFSIGVWLIATGLMNNSSFLLGVHIGLTFARAPLLYFYFEIIINPRFNFQRQYLVHFLPGIIVGVLLLMVPFEGVDVEVALSSISLADAGAWKAFLASSLMSIALGLHVVYFLVLLKRNAFLFLRNKWQHELGESGYIVLFQTMFSLVTVIISLAEQIVYGRITPLSLIFITGIGVVFFLTIMRYPEYMRLVKLETEKARYAQSRIQCLNLKRVFREMERLMEEEKIYAGSDLSLAKLAELLSIDAKQLSEILNNEMHTSFYDYINKHRIDEAKKLILENPELKIITVGYDVGFNTTSSFYKAFQKIVGTSPGEFRKHNA